ncbi:MAG: sugar nucleotide-binding protein [Patescibacteria group bacterium]
MKIYILGANGWMGGRFAEYSKAQGHEVFTNRIDISNLPLLVDTFLKVKPDVVVNFAGVRAYPTIDWCESHKEETVEVNVAGAINASLASITSGAYMIQIASGCIYSGGGDVSFTEEDAPNFFGSFYSRMRIVMQNALKELPVLQVRIRMPVSFQVHPRNLITKIVSYKKVISVPNSVTVIEDMFPALITLAEKRPVGILNLVNDGYVEHGDILKAYKEVVDQSHTYELIDVKELEKSVVVAPRSNCVLSNEKLKSLGISMPELTTSRLKDIMVTYKQSLT